MKLARKAFGLAASLAIAAFAAPGRAADCSTLDSPIYITGSTAVKPFLAEIAKILASGTPPVSIAYLGQGSCTGPAAILDATPLTGTFKYWDKIGAEQSCTVPTMAPVLADIGASDVFATTCRRLPGGLPSNVGDFLGPVQPMTFVVPKASTEVSISAEAAYYVYGFGADSGVEPWTLESAIFQRDPNSGTQRMVAAAIGVDADRWRGTPTTGSDDLKTKVSTSMDATRAIGILATDVAQENRAILDVLAYQHFGQTCGYYPDKDITSNEKQNVRDGHYAIWGPLHLFTVLNNQGYPVKPVVTDIIGFMTGTKAPPLGLDLIALQAQRHVVPQCAMRVKRTEEMGPLASFAPPGACGCYYDKVANGTTSCAPCANKTECPSSAPNCSYGYCEMY
jgi:ABC-type phosphate transport system substrate-binding protein